MIMNANNDIYVSLIADEEIDSCFKILSKSFGHDAPFVDIYFPNHDTANGQIQGSNRLTAWKHASQDSTFLKAVTSVPGVPGDEQRIIGFAVWTHMKEIPPQKLEDAEDAEEVWPDPSDRKFMAGLWQDYVKSRTQAVTNSHGKGIYVLELLAVHPDYQRMGAGTALVTWGIQASDKLQVEAVVEGTPAGRRIYEKCGMSAEIEEMRFDPGEEFSQRKKPKLVFMTRRPIML
ncbi:hypothetical protein F4777DRAFT_537602 [Nemania sp. FL0916]|nr:hypothetical protein F4777DRAFT_537602 [Nemania sp. FL0916]